MRVANEGQISFASIFSRQRMRYEFPLLHLDWGHPMLWRCGRMSLRYLVQGKVSNLSIRLRQGTRTSNLVREDRIKDLSFLNLLLTTHLSISSNPKTAFSNKPPPPVESSAHKAEKAEKIPSLSAKLSIPLPTSQCHPPGSTYGIPFSSCPPASLSSTSSSKLSPTRPPSKKRGRSDGRRQNKRERTNTSEW